MLTILKDPIGVTGSERFALDYGITLQENIALHLANGGDCTLRINGQDVDPLTDPRLDLPPGKFDLVTVVSRPGVVAYGALYYIALVAFVAYSYASMPNIPRTDNSTGSDSPNNRLTGQSNVARAYQGIPDVYGYRRVWPDLIQPSTVEYVNNVKLVTEWLCISRGKGTITDVQYSESAIGDISGSSYEIFEPVGSDPYPERNTTTLQDVYEAAASDEVNGQELPYAIFDADINVNGVLTTVDGDGYFTVTVPDGSYLDSLKAVGINGYAQVIATGGEPPELQIDRLCLLADFEVVGSDAVFTFFTDAWDFSTVQPDTVFTIKPLILTTLGPFTMPVDGERLWWSTEFLRGLKGTVWVRVSWWKIDDAGVEIAGTRETQDYSYSGISYDQYYFTTKVTPAAGAGRYQMTFARRTQQVDAQAADVIKLEEVYAVKYHATKEVPGVTVLRVTTKATSAATGFADRKFNLYWLRHVRTLLSDALSPTRNFARSIAHIWTLAGNRMSELDTDALAAINLQHGEDSPLLRFDGSLDNADMSLGDRMHLVANTARCQVWRDGTKWTVTREQARENVPEMQLDYRNLAAAGESTMNYASHLPASYDGVELQYVDEATQAKKDYVRLNITSGAPVDGICANPKKLQMLGCATTFQARNRALLEARRLIYQRTSVSDTALADAGALGILSVVRWVDPNDFGGDDLQAGEVMSIDSDALRITTSEPLDWKGETSGRIVFTGADGRPLGAPLMCFPSGDAVLLPSIPVGLYVADAARQCGSRYAFAVGLTSDEMASAGLYSATEIRPAADGTVSLALAAYDVRMFDDD